jgi:ribonuclease D
MARELDFENILDDRHLKDFCASIGPDEVVGFDTEFVSENRYRPELCLLQIAAGDKLAIVDTLSVNDLNPFWDLLIDDDRVTVAHAAREEFLFCFRDTGARPKNLFDLQVAAGLIGMDYPASYGSLVQQFCGIQLDKGETRTDWSRRPLSKKQIRYALQDVLHLEPIYRKIDSRLVELERDNWYWDEVDTWLSHLEVMETEPQWRRVSGISGLNRRALAVVREIYFWRDGEAKRKNKSPKRVLPDDLVIEISKRGDASADRLKSIRGFDRRVAQSSVKPIVNAVRVANELSDNELPERPPRNRTQNLGLLGQFVTTALNLVCRDASIAPNIVGTASDVRELAAWKLGFTKKNGKPPKLLTGWRKTFVEEWIDDVLDGKVRLRVGNPKSDQPLVLERE